MDVADVTLPDRRCKTGECARPTSWIYIVPAIVIAKVSVVHDAKAIAEKVQLKPGTSVAFSGSSFEL